MAINQPGDNRNGRTPVIFLPGIIMPGAGHLCDMEAPDRFNAEVRNFLHSVET